MVAHTKKHGVDDSLDHTGVSAGTDNGIVVFDSNGLPKEPTTDIAAGGQKITGGATPSADTDYAIKSYVDAVAEGLAPKDAARATSTTNIALTGVQTIDGVSIVADDRVLVQGQTTGTENGIYVASATAWARSDDMAVASAAAGAFTFITEGTVNDNAGFVCTNDKGTDIVGTDILAFTQFSGAGQITAGTGLTKTANTIDAIGGDGIVANANDLAIDLDTTPGLEINATKLRVKAGGSNGIILGATGVELELEASKGLSVGASGLAIAPDSTTGVTVAPLTLNANGVGVTVDNTTLKHTTGTISVKEGGLNMKTNVTLAGATPVRADVSAWADGDRGLGVGTDGSLWTLYRKTSILLYAVEMSEVGA